MVLLSFFFSALVFHSCSRSSGLRETGGVQLMVWWHGSRRHPIQYTRLRSGCFSAWSSSRLSGHWLLQTFRSLSSSINRPHMMRAWANCCSYLINHRTTQDTHAHESRCRNRGLCQCRLHWKPQTCWVIPDWGLQHRFRFKGTVHPRMLEIFVFTAVA